MEIMERIHLHLLLLLVTLIQGIQSQAVTPSSVVIAVGDNVRLECTTSTTTNPYAFSWDHITSTETVVVYGGGIKEPPRGEYDNFDLDEDKTAKTSALIINSILSQDGGEYRCRVSQEANVDPTPVTVEVGSASQQITLTSNDDDINPEYEATCDAIGSSPAETITWILDGDTQTDGIVNQTTPRDDSLFDTRSVFTFPATIENFNATLECNISGHQVAKLNRQEQRLVNIHRRPQSGDIIIAFAGAGADFTVLCDDTNSAAIPAMNTFNIYYNGTLITKAVSDNTVTFPEPEYDTEFRCEGSNYLESTNATKTFFPGSTTTPPPVTALETAPSKGNETGDGKQTGVPVTQSSTPDNIDVTDPTSTEDPSGGDSNIGLIIGVVVAVIVIIGVIIVVVYIGNKKAWFKSSGTPAPSNKPSGRAVGSSNGSGSEKDVESPLNGVKDVTAEEKLPQAAPRGHGSIQHTNDNPDQAMYAMVDKKPARGGGGAGDAPDRGSAPGQNEPQGMLYADLDLSHKAGHTDKHVPKNENDVVVYSSILV